MAKGKFRLMYGNPENPLGHVLCYTKIISNGKESIRAGIGYNFTEIANGNPVLELILELLPQGKAHFQTFSIDVKKSDLMDRLEYSGLLDIFESRKTYALNDECILKDIDKHNFAGINAYLRDYRKIHEPESEDMGSILELRKEEPIPELRMGEPIPELRMGDIDDIAKYREKD